MPATLLDTSAHAPTPPVGEPCPFCRGHDAVPGGACPGYVDRYGQTLRAPMPPRLASRVAALLLVGSAAIAIVAQL